MVKPQHGSARVALPTDSDEDGGGVGRWRVRDGDSGIFEAARNVRVRCRSPTPAQLPRLTPTAPQLDTLLPRFSHAQTTMQPMPVDWTSVDASTGRLRRQGKWQARLSVHSSLGRTETHTRAPSPLPTAAAGEPVSVRLTITVAGIDPGQLGFRGAEGDGTAAKGRKNVDVIAKRDEAVRRRFEAALAYAIDHAGSDDRQIWQKYRQGGVLTFEKV